MAGLGSSNVANTLLQTLQNLNAQSDQIVMSKETANVVQSLCAICAVLSDSAEAVAEATANPTVKQQLYDYSANVKDEMASLTDLKKAIEANPNAPGLKQRLIAAGRKVPKNMLVKRVIEDARACAKQAKALIMAVTGTFEAFFETCKQFGASSVALAKSLKDLIADIEDAAHKQRIHKAYEEIRDAGTRLVKAASVAFENPGNKECLLEVQTVGRELAAKIGVAIAIAQPEEFVAEASEVDSISLSAPVIPIMVGNEAQDPRSRNKTVRDPKQGNDILNKARTVSAMNDITQTLVTSTSATPSASPAPSTPSPVAASPTPVSTPISKTPSTDGKPAAATGAASAFIPPVSAPKPVATSAVAADAKSEGRSASPRPGANVMGGARGLSPQRPADTQPAARATPVAAAPAAKRPDSEVGTAATPASPQRNALTQSASAAFNANPNKGPTAAVASPDRPSSDRPASAAAAATGATQELEGLRSKNLLLEKEVAQLKAALAEARKEADQWREEFEGLNKAMSAVAQRMAKKT